jgi:hypothetical protein
MYISSSSTTTSLFLFIRTARMAVGNKSSQMVDCRYKIRQWPRRGLAVMAFHKMSLLSAARLQG